LPRVAGAALPPAAGGGGTTHHNPLKKALYTYTSHQLLSSGLRLDGPRIKALQGRRRTGRKKSVNHNYFNW
jgi:hypothetical protein